MKQVNPEALKGSETRTRSASSGQAGESLQELVTQARADVARVTAEANQEVTVGQELQIQLMQAQQEAERRREAKEKNRDMKEQISEVAGSRG